jgi:PAS domain S-box-containing protein
MLIEGRYIAIKKRSLKGEMKAKVGQIPATNPNPVLSVAKERTILYSNEAGELLLHEWGVRVGEKVPLYIGDFVQRAIFRNSPEKMEVKAGKKVYLITFYPSPGEECVNIYGFNISEQKELEEKLRIKKKQSDILHKIGKIALGQESLQAFMDESVKLITSILELDYCKIMELLPDGKFLMRAGTGWKSEFVGKNVVGGEKESQAGYTLLSRRPVIVEDFEEENRFKKPEILKIHGVASGASVVIGSMKNVFGVLVVNSTKKRKFTSDDTYFLTSVAFLIAQVVERKKTEEALRLSSSYNRSLIEASLDPLVTIGLDGKITDVNGATEQVTGYSRNELIGTDFSDYFTEPEKANAGYRQVFTDGKVWDYPLEIHKDGHITPVLYNASVYKDEHGEVIGVFAAARDITERKKAEEALKKAHDSLELKVKERTAELEKAYKSLKESEKGLADAQKMAHLGNWDWNLITDEMHWSDEMCRIFGLTPRKFGSTYNEVLSRTHPDDRECVDNAVKKALNGEPFSIDHRIVLTSGEERTVHVQGDTVFDENGSPVQMRGTVQDITERKKAEVKIQNLANIVESSNDAIITESLDGIITSWNKGAEQIYGYYAEEIIGKNASILEPDNLKGEIDQLVGKIKLGEKIENCETLRLKMDGAPINVSVTISPIFDASGKLTAISVIARDITSKKRSQEALANLETARKKEIHHRIKNNLQVISSLLDLQAEKFKNRECVEESEVLNAFKESQDRVMSIALIHEELHEGRGNDTLNFSPYLKRLAKNLFQTYRVGNAGTSLDIELEKNIFFDMDIAVPLGIVINELVSNSLKYAFPGKEKGEIQIKLCRDESAENTSKIQGSRKEGFKGNNFVLSVSDNGVGMPECFNLGDPGTLGIQLVMILADQLGGELEVKRENGTEFIIRFIVAETDSQIEPDM